MRGRIQAVIGLIACTGISLLVVFPDAFADGATHEVKLATPSQSRVGAYQVPRPSPGDLIVGKAITLPPALFEANRPGSPSLITPRQAHIVAETMWGLWEKALVESDTRALSQLIAQGPTLAGTINNCASPSGTCVEETSPRTFSSMEAIVPLQRTYPLYFLAAFRTTAYVSVSATNALESWQPWVELQILTKASPSAPWQLSFDTGYSAVGGGPPPLLPFDLHDVAVGAAFPVAYSVKPRASAPVSVSQFLPLLANYYQSFKDTGHAPKVSWFVRGGYANSVGQGLSLGRQGELYAGHRENYYFSGDASAGSWEFSTVGGYPMLCGSVLDTATDTAISGYLNQNADESNYGVPLPPGGYRKITSLVEHETCVFVVQGRLDNAGDNLYGSAVTGQGEIPGPQVEKDTTLYDLETSFGVLAYQLAQYGQKLAVCGPTRLVPCARSFLVNAAYEFAMFSYNLVDHHYSASVLPAVDELNRTARQLSQLFEQLSHNPQGVTSVETEIEHDTINLTEQYATLLRDLSPLLS